MTGEPIDAVDLSVRLGRLTVRNPILVASGTFGYGREMSALVDFHRLGALIPKTVTRQPRAGNAPWRTVETAAGMLNAIGLDNDGVDAFLAHHLPYLGGLPCPTIVSIAGAGVEDYVALARRLDDESAVSALELNISCPNVAGGVDFGTDPRMCHDVVSAVRNATSKPIIAKLTPNVTRIALIAKAAAEGGADAVSLINTVLGMAVDWRRRRPLLAHIVGGLSGPAIKPIALRCVYQVAQGVAIPIIGIGGIANIDDVMEFLVTGASAVQVGTANYYCPNATMTILDQLPAALRTLQATCVTDVVGSLAKRSHGASSHDDNH